MYEINPEVARSSLMLKIMELVEVCGGWDEAADDFKPGVKAQLDSIEAALMRLLAETTCPRGSS